MFNKKSTWIKTTNCMECGKLIDMTKSASVNADPKEGDVSICIACGGIMVFTDNQNLRQASEKEQQDLQAQIINESPEVWKTVKKIRALYLARKSSRVN